MNDSRLNILLDIAKKADSLELWMALNSGTNDDWPIQIKCDKEGSEKLADLLRELCASLYYYRTEKDVSTLDPDASVSIQNETQEALK